VKRVAPELDSLIWTLVEEGNDRAVEEFLARYPEMRQEVARRSTMVKGLKKMKPETEVQFAPPPFRPAEHVRYQGPTRMVYVVAALVLAALGVASFTVTYIAMPRPADPPKVQAPPPKEDPAKFEDVGTPKGPETNPGKLQIGDEPPIVADPPVTKTPKPAKQIAIKLEEAPLHTVFQLITAESGVKVVIAPGTPNPSVKVHYEEMTPMEILEDMGKEHGFTPMDQGDGSIIIVPAVEKGNVTDVPSEAVPLKKMRERVGG
jgi:hypothetical protein